MKKNRIYWILQIGGWSLFAAINIILRSLQEPLNGYYVVYYSLESAWYLVSTHIFRHFIIKWGWLDIKIKRIITKIFLAISILSVSNFIALVIIRTALAFEFDSDPASVGIVLLASFLIYFVYGEY